MIRALLPCALALLSACSTEVFELPPGEAADGGVPEQPDAAPRDAEPIVPPSCESAPIVLHPTAGALEGLSLASSADRWALTYAHLPPDGSEEITYLLIVDGDGRAIGAARPVEPYARVVALGDGFLLVGPNLETPIFVQLDRDGLELQRANLVPAVLGRGAIGMIQSTGDTVVAVSHDTSGDHVFTVRATSALTISHELDLAPITAESIVFGLHPDRVLRVSTVRTWDMEPSVLAMERGAGGAWKETFAIDAWANDGPNKLHSARWIEARREWWVLGTRRIEGESDWHTASVGRLTESGASLGAITPPGSSRHFSGYPSGAIDVAGSRPAILFATGGNNTTIGVVFATFEPDGSPLGRSDLAFENNRGNRALLAWSATASRFGTLGTDADAGLVFRCDLTDDGEAEDFAPPTPIEPNDLLPASPPASAAACGPDSPIVAIDDPLGVRLLGFARAGDAFGVLTESALIVVDARGVERARVESAHSVAELDGAFLVAAGFSQRLELIDPSGAKLAEVPYTTEIHETRASFGGLAARGTRASMLVGGELFAIDWDRATAQLTVGTSTRANELGLIGLEPDRALYNVFGIYAEEYLLQSDGTWSKAQVPWTSRFAWPESAAWHAGEQRWWVSGTIEVPGTPYLRAAIERVDPTTGNTTFDALDVPATRRPGSMLVIEPDFDPAAHEAMLAGSRFFATSPLTSRIDLGFTPYTTFIAPERETGSYAYATEGGSVPNDLPQLVRRRWIEVRCGLR